EDAVTGRARRPYGEYFGQPFRPDFMREGRMGEDCFRLGAEQERTVQVGVEEGLYADAVAAQEEASLAFIPDGEGEDAVEPVDCRFPPFNISNQQHLGIAMRAKHMAPRFK